MGKAPPPAPSHLRALDGVRGLAILAVLVHHLNITAATAGIWSGVVEFCGHGVDLFFALSGFLIIRGLQRSSLRHGWQRDFVRRRVAKIVPIYALVVAGVYLLLPGLLQWAGAGDKAALQTSVHAAWPWYLAFASNVRNALDGRFTNPALDVAWSLGVEVQFYALALFWFSVRPGRIQLRWLAAIAVLAVAFRTVALWCGANWIQILTLTPGRLDAFAAGAWICIRPLRLPRSLRLTAWALLPVVVLVGWSREFRWVEIIGYSWVALASACLIDFGRLPASARQRLLCSRPLVWLGGVSYSVYLTHLPIRAALRDYLTKPGQLLGHGTWLDQLAFYGVAGSVCLLVGWLIWLLVENPARRLILHQAIVIAPPASGVT
jgi:peptidoglycan/LPS O-acetylase OafA/YrhL